MAQDCGLFNSLIRTMVSKNPGVIALHDSLSPLIGSWEKRKPYLGSDVLHREILPCDFKRTWFEKTIL